MPETNSFSLFAGDMYSLRTFATDWKEVQREKDDQVRKKLTAERSLLIENGEATAQLKKVLKDVCMMYSNKSSETSGEDLRLNYTMASRLWYRCGVKLSCLDTILKEDSVPYRKVSFGQFFDVVNKVVEADERVLSALPAVDSGSSSLCEVINSLLETRCEVPARCSTSFVLLSRRDRSGTRSNWWKGMKSMVMRQVDRFNLVIEGPSLKFSGDQRERGKSGGISSCCCMK